MLNNTLRKICENIEKVMVGKSEIIELCLVALSCGGHVLIEDVPGVGKTTLVTALSKSINAGFRRIQFTPDVMPSDVTGFSIYNKKSGNFEFMPGAIMSNIVLADEINRTSPKTQASMLEAMEEKQVTIDGITYALPKPFMVLATQNPIEYTGTYPLPEAQLDRFLIKISLGYPDTAEEYRMLKRFTSKNPMETLEPVATCEEILEVQNGIKKVHVDDKIYELIIKIIALTRNHDNIVLGCSPRASIALLHTAQAWAFYNERSYVLPDDIIKMAPYVLSHRIVLANDAKIKKLSPADIINSIIKNTKIPMEKAI